MLNGYALLVFLMLIVSTLSACGGGQNRPNDAQPLPADVPAQAGGQTETAPLPAAATETPPAATPVEPASAASPTTQVVEPTLSAETQTGSDEDTILTFNIVGGIAGFCDDLTINGLGEFVLLSCNSGTISGVLDEPDRISLQTWAENLADFQVTFADNPGGPDNMTTDLIFSGQGQIEADEAQQQVIFDWVSGLMIRLRTQQQSPATPTPEPVAVDTAGLCLDIKRPALLTIDPDNPTILTVVDADSRATCNIALEQPPFGRIAGAAGNLYYPIFSPDSQTVTIWKLGSNGQQAALDFTTVTMAEPAPYDFVLSNDGSKIAWLWTTIDSEVDPPLYRNNLQIANVDGSNPVIVLDQAENNEQRFATLIQFSTGANTLFYSLQPDVGGPIFSGRYDTLYSVPATGGQPQFLYSCSAEENPVCIGGVSPDGSVVTVVQPQAGTIQVLNREGGVINTLSLPATDYVERTAFGPNGNMAFLSATLFQTAQGEPPQPNPGYISFVAPPYTGAPQTLLSNNSVGTLRGWLDENRLIFGFIDQDGNTGTAVVNVNGQVTELSPNVAIGVLK